MLKNKMILFKGGGDFASGSIRRLYLAGANIVVTELAEPLSIRRLVAFSEAIYRGEHTVEGVTSVKANPDEVNKYHLEGKIPVLVDPEAKIAEKIKFDIIIDGRMAKMNLGTNKHDAPIVVGLGPGFEAGVDCHAVVETLAGNNLGKVLYNGKPADDTGVPVPTDLYQVPCSDSPVQLPCCSEIAPCNAGFDVNDYLLRAPSDGQFFGGKNIGDMVKKGETIGIVNDVNVISKADGVLRGIIHDGVRVTEGLKIGDIDPSGDVARTNQISEKANAIAGGVLEACLNLLNNKNTEI